MPIITQATDRGAKGNLTDAWPRTHTHEATCSY